MADEGVTRRVFLVAGALAPVLAACGKDEREPTASRPASQPADTRPPTPACGDGRSTPEQTEGPFFRPSSPQRTSLLDPGLEGTRLQLTGVVMTTACRPIGGALLDFWQADDAGQYDNSGFRLRGHQFADARGRYRLETIVPGNYSGRTRHIHVKVQPRGGAILTTQLYFPGDPGNESDGLFDPSLLVARQGGRATFDFVLA